MTRPAEAVSPSILKNRRMIPSRQPPGQAPEESSLPFRLNCRSEACWFPIPHRRLCRRKNQSLPTKILQSPKKEPERLYAARFPPCSGAG